MTEQNPYFFDEAGQALVDKHIALTPVIETDLDCRHYALELLKMSDGQTNETAIEARAMTFAVLKRIIDYEGAGRVMECLGTMDENGKQSG